MTNQTGPIRVPDLSSRPFELTAERTFALPAEVLFRAWTERFDTWFADRPRLVELTWVTGAIAREESIRRFSGSRIPITKVFASNDGIATVEALTSI